MDWLRSEDLKEEKNVTAPIVIVAAYALCRSHEAARRTIGPVQTESRAPRSGRCTGTRACRELRCGNTRELDRGGMR
jgi:hypothetical protein